MESNLYIQKQVNFTQQSLYVDGKFLFRGDFQELYNFLNINYLRFFKMDKLSKTLFLCSEALLKDCQMDLYSENPFVAIVLYNGHSSLDTDIQFQQTIKRESFFPSPSLFVYTLPNIALGEISIRNKFMGENCTFIAPSFDAKQCVNYVMSLINNKKYEYVICGWFDYNNEKGEAKLFLISRDKSNKIFNINNIEK